MNLRAEAFSSGADRAPHKKNALKQRDGAIFRFREIGRRLRVYVSMLALALLALDFAGVKVAFAADAQIDVKIGFIRGPHSRDTISILDIPADDDGIAGARLAAEDNNTTGKFLGQSFEIEDVKLKDGDDPLKAFQSLADKGVGLILVDLPANQLLAVADAARTRNKDILLFNTSAYDDSLREQNCRADVIHVAPTYSMLADGLTQYLVWKRWPRWFMIKGSHPEDELFAEALRHSAKKFGAKIVEERTYQDTGGGRRSDSGSVQTQRLIPTATQGAPSYDVLVAADRSDVFANYLPYRTYDPRPVAGSAGLKPTSWDPSHEQWGAYQLQSRFFKLASRGMNARDNQAWVAVRMIGEAANRTGSNDPKTLRDYMTGPDFSIAAFKGQKQTLRHWNQQLRQPILLGDGRMIVSVSPQEGFLHQVSELDTLGFDQPETKCKLQ
ncbi:Branched-chain amino acid ABC transporter substrate-binding protein [Methylocella tundrae]|uniref:Branched-chain amino acid ABC transporter substrate-binding protein n=2 Tax=Methylocella tundrae TaxID=227605 RepID=A0A4U8YZ65_METTU|nr:Branched-chain amino acid ABC transporter substrate-binding protein [Methylocella tundrae]